MIEAREEPIASLSGVALARSRRTCADSLSTGFIHYPPAVLARDALPELEGPARHATHAETRESRKIAVRRGPGRALPSRIAVPDF
ncbi:MAG: hypothetical protein HY720_32230 [Planctomycetes bacterium]|nr:hypothetical protein [Planctomycetota bacterium]